MRSPMRPGPTLPERRRQRGHRPNRNAPPGAMPPRSLRSRGSSSAKEYRHVRCLSRMARAGATVQTYERSPGFFDGLSDGELATILGALERRSFKPGATLLVEGDRPREMYVVQSGVAHVYVADREGHEHLVNRVGPGNTLGEMPLLTGEPASATVRAAGELDVLVMNEQEFRRAATTAPR